MANYYCKCCGFKASNVSALTNGYCARSQTKKHILYEGSEKSQYVCKFCGFKASSVSALVNGFCTKSQTKKHEPAL